MKFAQIKEKARKLLKKGQLIWIPMMRIRYMVESAEYDMLFDAFLYKYCRSRFILVALIRNPSDFTFEKSNIKPENVLSPLVEKPSEIIEDLIDFSNMLRKRKEEIIKRIRYTPLAQTATLFMPFVGSIYSKPIDELWIINDALSILESLSLTSKRPQILSHEIVFVPLVVDLKKKKIYEPALSEKESRGLSFLLRKYKNVRDSIKRLIEKVAYG